MAHSPDQLWLMHGLRALSTSLGSTMLAVTVRTSSAPSAWQCLATYQQKCLGITHLSLISCDVC